MIAVAALLSGPLRAFAQHPAATIPRIGFLGVSTPAAWTSRVDAFRAGLRDLGYVEGKTIAIEYRFAQGQYDRLPDLAAELVRLKVDVIVTHSAPGALAAKQATATNPIPVVMTNVSDAVGAGIVSSLARPGGNITGDTFFVPELAAKRLELLKDAIPRLRRVAVLANPDNTASGKALQAMEVAARELNVTLLRVNARNPAELDGALAAMAKDNVDAFAVIEDIVLIPATGGSRSPRSSSAFPRSASSSMRTPGDSSVTARTIWHSIVVPPSSSTRSSKAPSPATFRSSDRRRSNS